MEFDGDVMDFARPGAGDEKLFVVFYKGVMKDDTASVEQGRPIYFDCEMVRIYTPGDRNNVVDRPVRDSDKSRWPKQYMAFKAGGDEAAQTVGTPLREWPGVGRAMSEELTYFGIRTVEQLAEANDAACMKVGGLYQLKKAAAIWLDKSKATAEATKAAKELEDAHAQRVADMKTISDLASRVDMLAAQLEKQTGGKKVTA
jgi:hypothetical protein